MGVLLAVQAGTASLPAACVFDGAATTEPLPTKVKTGHAGPARHRM
jgi:hypothetical protein